MAVPELGEVLAYIGDTSWSDAEVQSALDAETAAQQRIVRSGYFLTDTEDPAYLAYPDDLAEALKRRVARNLEMRGLPLSVQTGDIEAPASIPRLDPEIRRYEYPHRRLPVG